MSLSGAHDACNSTREEWQLSESHVGVLIVAGGVQVSNPGATTETLRLPLQLETMAPSLRWTTFRALGISPHVHHRRCCDL
eukprot:COSAG02_NODE_573_length_20153_cov_11.609305_6_plen_81_part_00